MKIKQVIDFVEDYSKPGFNAMWSFVINALRPFSAGMGLRVSHLSPQQVEIVIPHWLRNQDEGPLHEATFLTAVKEGQRLWLQRLLGSKVSYQVQSYSFKIHHPIFSSARASFSFESKDIEIFLRETQQKQVINSTFIWQIKDESEKIGAEIEIQVQISVPHQIESSGQKKRPRGDS